MQPSLSRDEFKDVYRARILPATADSHLSHVVKWQH